MGVDATVGDEPTTNGNAGEASPPTRGRRRRWVRRSCAFAFLLALAPLGVLVLRAFDARGQLPLQPWHRLRTPLEVRAGDDAARSWSDYLDREDRLFADVHERLARAVPAAPDRHPYQRHVAGSQADPRTLARDWNRTTVLEPAGEPRGAVLGLHGLSDSPYSLRALAEALAKEGYLVAVPRLPGHGTVPGALADARWDDWSAVVELGARELERRVGDRPIHVIGYSTGGTLALVHALHRLESGGRLPDRIVLLSPALGVTPLARLGSSHALLSWLPPFEPFAWQRIAPEFDPFKHWSFPKAAGRECHLVTTYLSDRLAEARASGRLDELPPVLALQSVVDATVVTDDLVDRLFDRLEGDAHQLVLFDVNRAAALEIFLRGGRGNLGRRLAERDSRPWTFSLVTNVSPDSSEVLARTWAPGGAAPEVERLGLAWPDGVHSLSHVALPFPPDDPVYGSGDGPDGQPRLGALEPRGESGVLVLPADLLLRLRHDPFHAYLERRVLEFLTAPVPTPP